jgi:hypothetical protein
MRHPGFVLTLGRAPSAGLQKRRSVGGRSIFEIRDSGIVSWESTRAEGGGNMEEDWAIFLLPNDLGNWYLRTARNTREVDTGIDNNSMPQKAGVE